MSKDIKYKVHDCKGFWKAFNRLKAYNRYMHDVVIPKLRDFNKRLKNGDVA